MTERVKRKKQTRRKGIKGHKERRRKEAGTETDGASKKKRE